MDLLDADIRLAQQRLVQVLEGRLGEMLPETKERYFAVLSLLVEKLETPRKPLRDVLHEVMSEAASLVFAELGTRRRP